MKTYNISYNVGRCKYVVSYHDGVSTHNDGSQFFDIKIFKSKKLLNSFVKELKQEGYI